MHVERWLEFRRVSALLIYTLIIGNSVNQLAPHHRWHSLSTSSFEFWCAYLQVLCKSQALQAQDATPLWGHTLKSVLAEMDGPLDVASTSAVSSSLESNSKLLSHIEQAVTIGYFVDISSALQVLLQISPIYKCRQALSSWCSYLIDHQGQSVIYSVISHTRVTNTTSPS